MKLTNYLVESTPQLTIADYGDEAYQDMAKEIKKSCKPYLSLMGRRLKTHPFHRSMTLLHDIGGAMYMKDVRKDRKAHGMRQIEADNFNKWLIAHGHLDRKKSISVKGVDKDLFYFGNTYVIYPIGKFQQTNAATTDVNTMDKRYGWDTNELYKLAMKETQGAAPLTDTEYEVIETKYKKLITTDFGIAAALVNGFEIWINPKAYYIVSKETHEKILEYL